MKILVTGAAGFIGTHLVGRLLHEGNYVIGVDNFYTGRRQNIAEFISDPNFKFIEHDINHPLDPGIKIDQIYNLACPASPPAYQKDPVGTTRTNVVGMINMLELARQNNATILQASTSEIYGDPQVHPQDETYNGNVSTLGPRACYDEGKRCAETLCMDYFRQHGTGVKIVRIFNTYGPFMYKDDGRVVSNFIVQALKGEDLTIYGDGSQTRSFQYIDDLLDGMLTMMQTKDFTGPVNIGNPHETSISELARLVIKLSGSSGKITYKNLPEDDPKKRKPEISLAEEKLGYKPKITLEEGLKKTIEYFKAA